MNTPAPASPPRSKFVTSLAWSFIALSILGMLLNVIQLAIVSVMLSPNDLRLLSTDLRATQSLPDFVIPLVQHLHLWLGLMLLIDAFTLVASIALLRRREWARWTFVVMMMLGALSNVAGGIAPFFMQGYFASFATSMPAEMRGEFASMSMLVTWGSALFALAFAALFFWAGMKLLSPQIRREFAK